MTQLPHPDKHAAILDAAQARFARFGASKVTMEEIAADLGMSKAALYYYFKTKEEIFRQVISREQDEFIAMVEGIIAENCSAAEKLMHYFEQHLSFLNELLNLKVVSIQAADSIHPIMHDLFQEFSRRETALLERIITEGKVRNEFTVDSAEETASLLLRLLLGFRLRFVKSFRDRAIEQRDIAIFEGQTKLFAKIFLKGISR
jgi:AcrR family transcriptional regulator